MFTDNPNIPLLHEAAANDNDAEIRRLVQLGVNPSAKKYRSDNCVLVGPVPEYVDNTALHIAVHHGAYKALAALIELGADAKARNYHGAAPLHLAAARNDLTAIEMLLPKMAIVDVLDYSMRTPMFVAAQKGFKESVSRLLQAGANVNAQNSRKCTALLAVLMWADDAKCTDLIPILIDAGADVNIMSDDHHSPLQSACWNETPNAVIALLRAKPSMFSEEIRIKKYSLYNWRSGSEIFDDVPFFSQYLIDKFGAEMQSVLESIGVKPQLGIRVKGQPQPQPQPRLQLYHDAAWSYLFYKFNW